MVVDIDATDVAIAIKVLRAAADDDSPAAQELRASLMPAINNFSKRQRQRQRRSVKTAEAPAVDAAAAPAAAQQAVEPPAADGVVRLSAPHLSRPLYPNPVCFLSTWLPGRDAVNVMTISWLTPIDNEGRFFCSMNQRRFSATLLAANPFFCLSAAVGGLEPLLTRVGGCSGARITNKPSALGVGMCRPGWVPLSQDPGDGVCRRHATADDDGIGDAGSESARGGSGSHKVGR